MEHSSQLFAQSFNLYLLMIDLNREDQRSVDKTLFSIVVCLLVLFSLGPQVAAGKFSKSSL